MFFILLNHLYAKGSMKCDNVRILLTPIITNPRLGQVSLYPQIKTDISDKEFVIVNRMRIVFKIKF